MPTSPPRFLTLVLLAALSVLSLNMFLPSLASIAAEFGVSYALVSLAMSGYLAITAVVQIIVGPLSDRYGRRPLLLASLGVFTLASVGCVLANDIRVFLGFRVLQAAIVSTWGLSMAMIRDSHPQQKAASLMGYVSMAMAVGPMIGPMIGGGLDALFGWRANFMLFAASGVALLGFCWIDVAETNKTPSTTFASQFRAYPALLGSGAFWAYSLCMTFSVGTFYTFLAGAPLVAEAALGLSSATLGFFMGSTTAGFGLGSFLAGRYAKHFAPSTMMITGRGVASGGLAVGLGFILAGFINPLSLFGSAVFVGIGNGITMPSASAGAMSIRPDLAGSASGLAGALTVAGGALLTWVTGNVISAELGIYQLPSIMLGTTLLGLLCAVYLRWHTPPSSELK